MNKRSWTWIIVAFLLFDAVVFGILGWWFLLRKPAAASRVFHMLPESTLALLYIPDGEGSKTRWQETSLHKIWTEPSIQALVAKPMGQIPDNPQVSLFRRAVSTRGVSDFFLAVTTISPKPTILMGVHFKDNAAEVDKVLGEVETELRNLVPEGQSGMETRGSQTFRSYGTSAQKVFSAVVGEWRFWSNDVAAIERAIQAMGDEPLDVPSLNDSLEFQKVVKVIPSRYDGVAYLNLVPVRAHLLGLAASTSDPQEFSTAIKGVDAASVSIGFSGPQIREIIRIAASPESLKAAGGTLTGDSIKFTTAETVAFYETLLGNAQFLNLEAIEKMAAQSPDLASAQNIVAKLKENGITTESINRSFGPEASVQVEWAKGMMQPRAFFRLGVKDQPQAAKIVDFFTKGAIAEPWKQRDSKVPGAVVYSLPIQPALMQPVPTLGLSKDSLVVGMNGKDVEAFLGRAEGKGKTIEASEAFQEALKQLPADGSSYVFIDTKALFTQIYGSVKSALTMMNMFSGSASALPVQKLPPTEDIAKHLHPFAMSTKIEGDVIRIESSGPVTLSQSVVGAMVGVTGVIYSQGLMGNLPIPGLEGLPLPFGSEAALPEPAGP